MPFTPIWQYFHLSNLNDVRENKYWIAPSDGEDSLEIFEHSAYIQAIVEFILANISEQISSEMTRKWPANASINIEDQIKKFQEFHGDIAPITSDQISIIENRVIIQAELDSIAWFTGWDDDLFGKTLNFMRA